MVYALFAGLFISIVGLVSLFMVKRWELQTGRMLFATARPAVGRWAKDTLVWFEHALPKLVVHYGAHMGARAEHWLHKSAAHALLSAEHGLERVLNSLRGVTEQPRSSKEASAFLREVAEHKRQLLSKNAPQESESEE